MRDFDSSTLWQVSGYERARLHTGGSGFTPLTQQLVLPSTLLAELGLMEDDPASNDVLEVVAACVRHREAASLVLECDGLVWPVSLFPAQAFCHSPRDLARAAPASLATIKVLSIEPPGVRPPGNWMYGQPQHRAEHYRPLQPLLWALALGGPRAALLREIDGTAAYRALKNPAVDDLPLPGALGPAVERLRRETVSLRTICGWAGMSVERGARLLNGLYLTASLLVTRGHPNAAAAPKTVRALLGSLRRGR